MPDYSMAVRAMKEALLALSVVQVTLDGSDLERHSGELLDRAMVMYRRCEDAAEAAAEPPVLGVSDAATLYARGRKILEGK